MPYFHWSKEVRNVPCLYCHLLFSTLSHRSFSISFRYTAFTRNEWQIGDTKVRWGKHVQISHYRSWHCFYWHLTCFPMFFSHRSTEIDFSVRFYRIRQIRMVWRTSEVLLLLIQNMLLTDTNLSIFHSFSILLCMKEALRNDFSDIPTFLYSSNPCCKTTTRGNLITFLSKKWFELDSWPHISAFWTYLPTFPVLITESFFAECLPRSKILMSR